MCGANAGDGLKGQKQTSPGRRPCCSTQLSQWRWQGRPIVGEWSPSEPAKGWHDWAKECPMQAPWAVEEMRTVDLKDKRHDDRLRIVLSQLEAHPTASIPAACGGWAETTAAYRLFDNDEVGFDDVIEPHLESNGTDGDGSRSPEKT